MNRRRWSEDEIAKLRGMAQKFPSAQIASELGRGVAAVAVKAHELKLSLRMNAKQGNRPPAGSGGDTHAA